MAEERRYSFAPKRLGPQISEARLKKIVLDPIEATLTVMYAYGTMQGGVFVATPDTPDYHRTFALNEISGNLTQLRGVLTAVHTYIVGLGEI